MELSTDVLHLHVFIFLPAAQAAGHNWANVARKLIHNGVENFQLRMKLNSVPLLAGYAINVPVADRLSLDAWLKAKAALYDAKAETT